MRLAHNIKITVFSKEEESLDKIKEALIILTGFELEKERLSVKQSTAIGFKEKKIRILEIVLKKEKHTNLFLSRLMGILKKEQKEMLLRQIESRLDSNLDFFVRLDKEKLLNNECWVTDSGNCYHIKISIAAYPSTREKAIEIIEKIVNQ